MRFNKKYFVEGHEKHKRVVDIQLGNKIVEILDDTNSLIFLLPSQDISRDNIIINIYNNLLC